MKKLLISNRGEIVVRIIRTARDMGIKTVAVYSKADENAPHVREADEAFCIGPTPPPKSYLNIDNIMDAVKRSGADAVHPGYGFLSENRRFAHAVVESGVAFVGPSVETLDDIESKCYCRNICHDLHIPVVPGTLDIVKNADEIRDVFREYGPPLLLKLDKGGGGKGIQVIAAEEDIEQVLTSSSSMGQVAFGSSDCYVEKGLKNARHIEVQFLGDHYGNYITLGERECSIQRRYQKIIEDGNYYFMEVNARIQVEHPVTELITGMDIVKCQLDIASGKRLDITQEDVLFDGHAIEARIYAEDPVSFLPHPGTISKLRFPIIRKVKTRFEHALEEGMNVSPYYDPMLAKVVAWGSTRERAIKRLNKRLADFRVEGTKTSIPLARMILDSDHFIQGDFNTESLEDIMKQYQFNYDENIYQRL
ncbi:acetyl-CoA carboxylase biotin carboxylase subunit [Desulfocicer niacini]